MEATSFFVVFSTTFALSMDYEIFMINRMRETYVKTGSNEQAIRDGVIKTAEHRHRLGAGDVRAVRGDGA